jgi:guanylate kinase
MIDKQKRGNLIVLSGPSAVGKGTVLEALMADYDSVCYSISATTREPRTGEVDGEDYYFMSEQKFESLIEQGEFLEWAKVHNNYYGTPKKYVEETLAEGQDVILEIDIQGANQIKNKFAEAVLVFLSPPSLEELNRRLRRRGTETEQAMETRLENAKRELAEKEKYDYEVVNDELAEAVKKVKAIIIAERCKI